ncbi:MAG: hypothetical protein M3Y59_17490 [Myxococcota bacterium]|nr:hypothetical protein [Myxococcota bacterium]
MDVRFHAAGGFSNRQLEVSWQVDAVRIQTSGPNDDTVRPERTMVGGLVERQVPPRGPKGKPKVLAHQRRPGK